MSIRRPALVFDNVTVITNAILRDPDLSPAEKGVLGYVLSHAAGYELTMKQMIRENRAGRELLDTALKGLESRGYLKRTRQRSETGQLGGYDWEVTIDAVGRPVGTSSAEASAGNPTLVATSGNTESSQVGASAGKPNVAEASLGKPAPKNYKGLELELDLELQEQPPPAPAEPDPFPGWWKLYPKKVKKDAGEKAYRRALKKATADELLDGLRRYVAWLGPDPDPRYIAHPTTWLNEGRWSDELQANKPEASGAYVERNGVMLTRKNAEALDMLQKMRQQTPQQMTLDSGAHARELEGAPW